MWFNAEMFIKQLICFLAILESVDLNTNADIETNKRPNIIFILADDLGWTDVQAGDHGPNVLSGTNYGSKFYQTPNIAALAESGVSFTHCYSHPNCAPTRAAILTGQYAPRSGNGVYHVMRLNREAKKTKPTKLVPPKQRTDIPAEHVIYPELLKQAGYATCHVGKYHVGGKEGGLKTLPQNQGFDFNYGGTDKGGPKNYFAKNQKFSEPISGTLDPFAENYTADYLRKNLVPLARKNNVELLSGTEKHVEDAVGDAVVEFITNHISSSKSQPFYVQMHHYAVHSPISDKHARKDLLKKYRGMDVTQRHNHAAYGAILENLDQTVGRVMRCLDDPNQDGDTGDSIRNETIIFFTSDNGGVGPTDNAPLRHVKGSFFEGGIRVPLIVNNPLKESGNRQSQTLIHSVDFYPTILEAAGVDQPTGQIFDGESFWKVVSNNGATRERKSIFYHFPGYLDQRARPCSVVIDRVSGKHYKLIYNYDTQYTGNPKRESFLREGLKRLDSPFELYCITDDISETDNLLDDDIALQDEKLAGILYKKLYNWLNQTDETWNAKKLVERASKATVSLPQSFGR